MVSDSLFDVPAGDDFSREALLASQPERRLAAGLSLAVTPLALLAALLLVVKMPASAKPVELPAARLASRVEAADLIQTSSEPAPRSPAALPAVEQTSRAVSDDAPAGRPDPAPATAESAAPTRVIRTTVVAPSRAKRGTRRLAHVPIGQGIEIWPAPEPEPVRRAVRPPAARAVAPDDRSPEPEPVVTPRTPAPSDELKRPDFD